MKKKSPEEIALQAAVQAPILADANEPNKPKRKRRNSGRALNHLADRIFGKVLAITHSKLDVILAGPVGARLGIAGASPMVAFDDDSYEDEPSDTPGYTVQDGIACIPISGTLVKRSTGMDAMSGLTSYESLKATFAQVAADPDVKGILLDCDSPGGEVDGMFDLADFLRSMRSSERPMYAVCNDQMCSAAYALGSCADTIYITQTGVIGSVGCFMCHVDQSGMDKQDGLKFTYIQAGDKKTEGNPHEPLDKDAEATMQGEVDRIRNLFVSLVAKNRGVNAQDLMDTEAGVFFAQDGIPLLADKLGNMDDARADMMAKLGLSPAGEPDEPKMDPETDANPLISIAGLEDAQRITAEQLADKLAKKNDAAWIFDGDMGITPTGRVFVKNLIHERFRVIAKENGWAEHEYSAAQSRALFGQDKPVILAIRSMPKECRSANVAGSRKITMLAVPYDGSLSCNLGGFRESYQPGCFAAGLGGDLSVTAFHDEAKILGRVLAGTARFWEDAAGVHAEADAPETTWASDLLISMGRGDVTQSSAAFFILDQRWEVRGDTRVRVVTKALMREAAVLRFPAYENTSAAVQQAAAASPAIAAEETPAPIEPANNLDFHKHRLKLLKLR